MSDYNKDVFSLESGELSLWWPKNLPPMGVQEFEEISDWLDLMKEKLARSFTGPKVSPPRNVAPMVEREPFGVDSDD